jgi:hypothetical protein
MSQKNLWQHSEHNVGLPVRVTWGYLPTANWRQWFCTGALPQLNDCRGNTGVKHKCLASLSSQYLCQRANIFWASWHMDIAYVNIPISIWIKLVLQPEESSVSEERMQIPLSETRFFLNDLIYTGEICFTSKCVNTFIPKWMWLRINNTVKLVKSIFTEPLGRF